MLCAHCTFVLVYIPLHIKKNPLIFLQKFCLFFFFLLCCGIQIHWHILRQTRQNNTTWPGKDNLLKKACLMLHCRVKHFLLFNIYLVYVSICMCVWVCMCVCIYIHVCVYIYIYIHTHTHSMCMYVYIYIHIYIYTECPRRNVPNFGRVFLRLKYTDITQNTYMQSWTVTEIVTEIMAREKFGLLAGPRTVPSQLA